MKLFRSREQKLVDAFAEGQREAIAELGEEQVTHNMSVSMGVPIRDLPLDEEGNCKLCGSRVRLVDPAAPQTWIGDPVPPGDRAWLHIP